MDLHNLVWNALICVTMLVFFCTNDIFMTCTLFPYAKFSHGLFICQGFLTRQVCMGEVLIDDSSSFIAVFRRFDSSWIAMVYVGFKPPDDPCCFGDYIHVLAVCIGLLLLQFNTSQS